MSVEKKGPQHLGPDEAMMSVRISRAILRDFRKVAQEKDDTVSQVLRRYVREYIEKKGDVRQVG